MKMRALGKVEKESLYASIVVVICLLGALLIVLSFSVQGCAPAKGLTKEQTNLLRFYNFYNTQYMDYQNMTKDVDSLSEEKKIILRKKKEMLTDLYGLIKLYEIQVSLGDADSVETEQMIYDLLNKIE